MTGTPFVGRDDELETLSEAITGEDAPSLISIVGPTGIGKSTLLAEFAIQCRDKNYRVLRYNLKEPDSVEQFLSRLLDHWRDMHPSVVDSDQGASLQGISGAIGDSLSKTSNAGTSLLGAVLNIFSGNKTEENISDATSEILRLGTQTRNNASTEQFVLIIDEFDETRIDEAVYDEITTLVREIAMDAPSGIVCCVGTCERFYDSTNKNVAELELTPFEVSDVQMYLEDVKLEAKAADQVHEAASGSPYFVERIGQIAVDEGCLKPVLADLSDVERERRRMLEERFLDTLDDSTEHLLRDTCFLPELRPDPVAHVLERDPVEVSKTLRELERRSILMHLGYSKGNPVYRLHGLQRDLLRERLSENAKIKQLARAAGYYAIKLANTGTADTAELLTKEGLERSQQYMTAGVMFEYLLQKFPSHLTAEDRVEQVFDLVPSQAPSPREATLTYFAGYRNHSIAADSLDITPVVDPDSIQEALDNRARPSMGPGSLAESIIRGLRADDTLNNHQTEVFVLVADAAVHAMRAENNNIAPEEIHKLLAKRRSQLTADNYPNAPELCTLSRIVIDFIGEIVSGESDTLDAWATIEEAYGATHDDFSRLLKTARMTMSCMFDLSVIDDIKEEHEGSSVTAKPQLDKSASIEEDGIEPSISENLNSPLFIAHRALKSPTTAEVEDMSKMWSALETRFEKNEIPFLAAFCRDVREVIVDPVPRDSTKAYVGLKLMQSIDSEDLDVLDYEPVTTIATVSKAIQGVRSHDPEVQDS